MRIDFTLNIYSLLVESFLKKSYHFQSYNEFVLRPRNKVVILRHDVDRLPRNALQLANLEYKLGVKSSYYFRIVKKSNDPKIIHAIANLGHEIGYHYEDLSIAKGNVHMAIESFQKNLEYFRKFYPVRTIAMHGSPISKWDNRLLWDDYDYHDFGIIGEPYIDVDYNEVFYVTDTGRKWNNFTVSIRDKVDSKFNYQIKNTGIFIEMITNAKLPNKILLNTHPQRWSNFGFNWLYEYIFQFLKNPIKSMLRYINKF